MKVEGMQYPLSVKPIGARSGSHNQHKELSEDAVYFEPEERKDEQKNHTAQQENSETPLEQQVTKETVAEQTQEALDKEEKKERTIINIIV